MNRIKLLAGIVLMVVATSLKSQTISSIQIKDLMLLPDITANAADTNTLHFKLYFKISSALTASKVHMLFGNTKDSNTISSNLANFTHQSGIDNVVYNNESNPVTRYTAYIPVGLAKSQVTGLSYLTLFIEDTNGLNSGRLYYSFKP